MKNEGITILQIVVTILIMIIILAITFFSGQNVTGEAKLATVYNEIKEIESAIKEYYVLGDMSISGDSLIIQDEYSSPLVDSTKYSKELNNAPSGDYYYLDFTTSRDLQEVLDLEEVKNNYILDYANLNIYLVGGIDISKKESDGSEEDITVYDSDEIVNYYNNIFVK